MKKTIFTLFAVLLVCAVLSACGLQQDDSIWPVVPTPDMGLDYEAAEFPVDLPPEDEDYSTYDEYETEQGGLGEDGGAEIPVIRIEIHEDRIVFDGDEILLEELEEIIRANSDLDIAWELLDAYQAVRAVYSEVVEMLTRHGIAFIER